MEISLKKADSLKDVQEMSDNSVPWLPSFGEPALGGLVSCQPSSFPYIAEPVSLFRGKLRRQYDGWYEVGQELDNVEEPAWVYVGGCGNFQTSLPPIPPIIVLA
jgi:hypothetical protein